MVRVLLTVYSINIHPLNKSLLLTNREIIYNISNNLFKLFDLAIRFFTIEQCFNEMIL